MAYETRIEDGIIVFQFKSNRVSSISLETLNGLSQAIDRVNSEDDLKGLILIGTEKYFSGGFDLNEFVSFSGPEAIINWFKVEEDVLYKLFTCSKPVVAAVNGHATAAGMIVTMACDWRIAINNPKAKIGMTEIKIGLALTPLEAGLMRWGLDTEKNYRDIIFKGELIGVQEAVDRQIFDELADSQEDLLAKAKAKVSALIDTPGRPFINLKKMHRMHWAGVLEQQLKAYDFNSLVVTFTDPTVVQTLTMVKNAIGI
ncbi:MAG: enoyl-CoA hydratase/isomerase family protein [Solirubrobacterales bacterium]